MAVTVLLCTVGGSHQPILTAIRERRPAFVLFFCTDKDPGTGRPGSLATITGNGTPIEVRRGAEVIERLPNIPTLASLAADDFDTCIVPPDDLDGAVAIMLETMAGLRRRFPDAPLVADYTGGTKTMTAALVIAALESDGVELQLVTVAITGADLRPNVPGRPGTTWEDARDAFVEYMDRHHAAAHKGATWRTSPQIKALLGMADWAKASQFKGALRHMRLEPKKKVNEFVQAKQIPLALTEYPPHEHPETLAEARKRQRDAEAEAQKTDEDRMIDDLDRLFQQAQGTRNKNPGGPLGQRFNSIAEEAKTWPQDRKDRLIDLLQRINKFLDGDRKKRAAKIDAMR